MNAIKFALLGTAALVAVSASARAEDLSALKADMEAMNASTAVAVADVPASTTVVWAGTVKAAVVFAENSVHDADPLDGGLIEDISIDGNVELNVTGTTETAVGEVGASARFNQSWDGHEAGGNVEITRGYGWWKITPDLKFWAGRTGGNGGIGHGLDSCSCNFAGAGVGAVSNYDTVEQFGVAYTSGPASVSLAVEHHDAGEYIGAVDINWAGDTFSAELAGFAGEHGGGNVWQVGVGATASMDMFTLSAAAGYGEVNTGADYIIASLFARAALSDSVSAEIGIGYADGTHPSAGLVADRIDIAGGVYWSPASQLTIGAEVAVTDVGGADDVTAALVTVFKF